ncbi:MAG: hypothetical protein LBC68_13430 [Prevotellaceae bacterium]|jgi:hypothetical protein|nr:hypothetical protein [Prevotellaceae bacterium]
MKKRTLIAVIFIAFAVQAVFAQENPKRSVLFTLDENAIVETKFSFQKDIRYYAIIKDKTQNLEKLVLNGKVIDTAFVFMPESINLFGNITPAYKKYIKEQGYYCIANGKEYGSYEEAYILSNYLNRNGVNSIAFKQMGKWFVKLPDDRIVSVYADKNSFDKNDEEIIIWYDDISKNHVISFSQDYPYQTLFFNGKEFIKNYKGRNIIRGGGYNYENGMYVHFLGQNCLIDVYFTYYLNGNKIDKYKYKITETGVAFLDDDGININGKYYKTEGTKSDSINNVLSYCFNNKGQFLLIFLKNDKMFVNLNGKIIGQYDNPNHYISFFDGGIGFGNDEEFEWLGTRFYEHNQGEIDESVYEKPSMNNKGDYIFAYILNGKCYVNVNGKIEGSYERTWSPQLTENGTYAYWGKENGKEFIVINGEKRGPYDLSSEPILTKNGFYAYWYQIDGKRYFNINGKIEGFYDKYISHTYEDETVDPYYNQREFHIDENGNYLYVCEQDGKTITVINGKKYNHITDLYLTNYSPLQYKYEIGNATFSAVENNKIVEVNEDNKIKEDVITLTSTDNKDIMTCSSQYPYVIIDNKKYSNGEILAASYCVELNAFRWSVLEGNELVVYEYKLK